MPKISRIASAFLIAAGFYASVGSAQTFKVVKWNIGGDGGTDYLTAEAGTGRVFVSRGTHVMVVDGPTGRVLGDITDTPGVHGIAFAPAAKHGFTTNGGVVHQDSPDKYTVVSTVPTILGAKTIGVDPIKHVAYLFQPEYGPPPAPASDAAAPSSGGRGAPRGPIIGAWFFAITQ